MSHFFVLALAAVIAAGGGVACDPERLLLSADCGAGLNDTEGVCHHCQPSTEHCSNSIAAYHPSDTDDNWASLMAANSESLLLVAQVATFGNASECMPTQEEGKEESTCHTP